MFRRLNEKLEKFLEDIEKKQVANNTFINSFRLYNPNPKRCYIELSRNNYGYIKDIQGQGIITTGCEGHLKTEPAISHGSGDKIDVVYQLGYDMNYEKWAKLTIPFIKNNNTAFINFEGFSKSQFECIRNIILKWYPDLERRLNQEAKGKPNVNLLSVDTMYKTKTKPLFVFYLNNGAAPHLDIGIIPNSYTDNIKI